MNFDKALTSKCKLPKKVPKRYALEMNPSTALENIFRLTRYQKAALKKLGIVTMIDLLYHFPSRYESVADEKLISLLQRGDVATFHGTIESVKKIRAFRKRMIMTEAKIRDHTGAIKALWFHQPYIADKLKIGVELRFSGKIGERNGKLYVANPEFEHSYHSRKKNTALDGGTTMMYPVYPESRGITSKWFYHAIKKLLREKVHEDIKDSIPKNILGKYNLPQLKTALVWIHNPQKESHRISARKRFAFEEVFFIQLSRQKIRHEYKNNASYTIESNGEQIKTFSDRFPFTLTNSQETAIKTILSDFEKDEPMSRLLEGDVGSGKTAVAAITAYAVVTSQPKGQNFGNLQIAYMAPTEILAQQHFQSFMEYFSHMPIQIGLITGSGCKKFPSKVNPKSATDISRAQLLKWVKNGEIPILIGTHALIQKTVSFKHLAFIIIDEQHRFGTMQRAKLSKKNDGVYAAPHLLSMTATPIPRTLALTVFGDLDLTLLDEMPVGRKPIITEIISPDKRGAAYEEIATRLKEGRQLYVICPRIDEPDPKKLLALNTKSVKAEARRLKQEVFPEYEIEILHSKLRPAEKENIMKKFSDGNIDILVATSVVEVGVNVPNATMIVIEGAERFGLAQLHQLRGRVLRSNHQAYCYVFADTKSKKSIERLKAIQKAKSGFELAELDLEMRGSGELSGRKQWGISDIGMEAIKNIKMVEAARTEAQNIISKDPTFKKYPLIAKQIETGEKIHFE
ncbi:MAG: ATP-dependent DNA helicase RecG [Parcubacteria group bacterium]|nr:ATP-dependent DNA helicase RecG [Parcubacteria group bacterium]